MLDRLTIERMAEKAGEGPILIALSGGGDSVALLHLLAEHFGAARLRAVVIDHGLRAGSAADAETARAIARGAGVDARILPLSWDEGANRAHEAARRARYAALCDAARETGARLIATGHTRDDQAETVLLRASRGSGLRGLAAMRALAPAPLWPEGRGLWLARPLLGARRDDLRNCLKSRDARWIEDPANENQLHARVRVRGALAAMEREGLDPMRFAALAEQLQPLVEAIDSKAASLLAAAAFDADEIRIERSLWNGADAVTQRALEALIMAASGEERGPTLAQLESVCAAGAAERFTGATLAGARLLPRGDRILIRRDPGALSGRAGGGAPVPPLVLTAGEETIWDGRVALTIGEPGWSVVFDGSPQLQRGEERRPLAQASPHWLLRDHVQHVLGTN